MGERQGLAFISHRQGWVVEVYATSTITVRDLARRDGTVVHPAK
jgi:hypothetical protein